METGDFCWVEKGVANTEKAEPGAEEAANRWERRWSTVETPGEPASLLAQFAALLPPHGRALDVAAGAGRNSVYLAARGLSVVALDRSRAGLERGKELARERGVRIHWVQADLEKFVLPPSSFDVITCFYYRDPALYPGLREALGPGGVIFYETYTLDQLGFPAGPRNPAHLLEPGELLRAFGVLEVVFYHETWKGCGVASLVARKPVRSAVPLANPALPR
jgi:tellurite methyltransferase